MRVKSAQRLPKRSPQPEKAGRRKSTLPFEEGEQLALDDSGEHTSSRVFNYQSIFYFPPAMGIAFARH